MSIDPNQAALNEFNSAPADKSKFLIVETGEDGKQYLKCTGKKGVFWSKVKHFFSKKNSPYIQDVFYFIAKENLLNDNAVLKLVNNYYESLGLFPQAFASNERPLRKAFYKLVANFPLPKEGLNKDFLNASLNLYEGTHVTNTIAIAKHFFSKQNSAQANSQQNPASPQL